MMRSWLVCAAAGLVLGSVGMHAGAPREPAPQAVSGVGPGRACCARSLLRQLPQPASEDRRAGARHRGSDGIRSRRRGLGEDRSASCAPAPCRRPARRARTSATYARLMSSARSRRWIARRRPTPIRVAPIRSAGSIAPNTATRFATCSTLDVDVDDLLPPDDASYGFDNVSVADLSPTLMERYLAAAQKVSRLAVGSPVRSPGSRVIVLPPDLTQEAHRRRHAVRHARRHRVDAYVSGRRRIHCFASGCRANRNENVEGLTEPHQIELTLDGVRLQRVHGHAQSQSLRRLLLRRRRRRHLEMRVQVTGGPHAIGGRVHGAGPPRWSRPSGSRTCRTSTPIAIRASSRRCARSRSTDRSPAPASARRPAVSGSSRAVRRRAGRRRAAPRTIVAGPGAPRLPAAGHRRGSRSR